MVMFGQTFKEAPKVNRKSFLSPSQQLAKTQLEYRTAIFHEKFTL